MTEKAQDAVPQGRPSYEIVVREPRPRGSLARRSRSLHAAFESATALLGDIYAVGARHVLDRTEALEDRLAERKVRRDAAQRRASSKTGD